VILPVIVSDPLSCLRRIRAPRAPEPVRVASPLPLRELQSPVYDFVPLGRLEGSACGWRPARTDPLVFGPEGAGELQGRPVLSGLGSWCEPCGVRWRGGAACWACGRCCP
jgi:hypothetical protein